MLLITQPHLFWSWGKSRSCFMVPIWYESNHSQGAILKLSYFQNILIACKFLCYTSHLFLMPCIIFLVTCRYVHLHISSSICCIIFECFAKKYHETRPPLYHFLTTVCAIVGGTFTVAGIIDSMIFSGMEIIKKFELGKLS